MADILIIDNDAAIRRMLERLLQLDGYTVDTATGGGDAILQVHKRRPDLVVLGLQVPRMNGWVCYGWMQGNGFQRLPVLVVTAGGRLDWARQDLPAAGCTGKTVRLCGHPGTNSPQPGL